MRRSVLIAALSVFLTGCNGCGSGKAEETAAPSPTATAASSAEPSYPAEPQDEISFDELVYDSNGLKIRAVLYQKDGSFQQTGDMLTMKIQNDTGTNYILKSDQITVNDYQTNNSFEGATRAGEENTLYVHCWTHYLEDVGIGGNVKTVTMLMQYYDFWTEEPLDKDPFSVTIHVPSDEPYDDTEWIGEEIYSDENAKITGYFDYPSRELCFIYFNLSDRPLTFSCGNVRANGKWLETLETGIVTVYPEARYYCHFNLRDVLVRAGRIKPYEVLTDFSYSDYDSLTKIIPDQSVPIDD